MERIQVQARSSTGGLETLSIEISKPLPWKFTVSGLGYMNRVFENCDLFEALRDLRRELEIKDYQLLVQGARVDVSPSGMSRSMGGGRKAYIMQIGRPATKLVDIFDDAKTEQLGTVE